MKDIRDQYKSPRCPGGHVESHAIRQNRIAMETAQPRIEIFCNRSKSQRIEDHAEVSIFSRPVNRRWAFSSWTPTLDGGGNPMPDSCCESR